LFIPTADAMNTVPTSVSGPSTGAYWATDDIMNAVPTLVACRILLVFERYCRASYFNT
jgi:hypothetical protein